MTERIRNRLDIGQRLFKLCRSIAELQRERQREWISSYEIAKYQEGSEELAPIIESLASMPEADAYLIVSDDNHHMCLSEAGHALAESTPTAEGPVTQQVSDAVKAYARRVRRWRFDILNIYTIARATRRIVHAIEVDLGDALLPNDAPANVVFTESKTRVQGRIVGHNAEESIVYVALESSVAAWELPARLEIDRAFLLYQLAEALAQLPDIPERGLALLQAGQESAVSIQDSNSEQVADMLVHLEPPWTRFLWGPPGAGKTHGMARLMLQLLEDDPELRILLVAPSNIAVDVALQKFVDLAEDSSQADLITDRQVLRYGYPRKSEILAREELLGSEAQEEMSLEVGRMERELRKATQADMAEEELAVMRADLLGFQEKLKAAVVDHLSECRVVATTTTLAYMPGSSIASQSWDSVLVDEVTMVPPAVCLFLSSLADNRLLFAGDPRQLGPVYEGRSKESDDDQRWMGTDMYDFTGLATGRGENRHIETGDARLVRITSQRRCAPQIWAPIHHLYRGVSSSVNEGDLQALQRVPPYRGRALAIVDVGRERPEAVCEINRKSWQNTETAALTVAYAKEMLEHLDMEDRPATISIITPYRAQYKLIKKQLKELQLHHQVEVGTVHSYQGSEADIVIFDVVDGPGRKKLGALLKGETGLRLVNVAVSRAKGKLVVLADKSWCRKAMRRDDNPLLWDLVMKRFKRPLDQESEIRAPKVVVPLVETISRTPPIVAKEEPVREVEQMSLTVANISPELIRSLKPRQIVIIEDKAAKRELNLTLHSLNCQRNYDHIEKTTTWKGPDGEFRVDHRDSTLTREL